jgi:hypothetical protein
MNEALGPLIPESSTSETTTVEVVMNALRDNTIRIPDYQRDSDQWDEATKSLLIESVINNLSIPAFFFEVNITQEGEVNEVIDGQQRLTTLFDFYHDKLRLVKSQDAAYLSPRSVHYAGKTHSELPAIYKAAFRQYRIPLIKLRNLGDMRLEIFRRINQGGTPLSGQDIRLAYYGARSPSLALIRLAGVYDPDRLAAQRFLKSAQTQFGLRYPWTDEAAREVWYDWWNDKDLAHGQTASETFLWGLVVAQADELNAILQNAAALQTLKTRYSGVIDEALDVCAGQLRWQDGNAEAPPALLTFEIMRDRFFPYFQHLLKLIVGRNGPSLDLRAHRRVAGAIGAAYRADLNPDRLAAQQWTNLVEFIRRPNDLAKDLGFDWPVSKGRWEGDRGYYKQMQITQKIVAKIADGR